MAFLKGDIIAADFLMPDDGDWLLHSAVIISCKEVYDHDQCYVCAMMTSNGGDDEFSFHLDDTMLIKPSGKQKSQVRCHLITYVLESHIATKVAFNKLKSQAFERLIAHINESVFDV